MDLPALSGAALGRPLPRAFFARDARVVARALVGRVLVCELAATPIVARIVEVEAYRAVRDPASHAFRGRTPRNATMFGPPGHAYVYFTYGMHHCLNLVCEPAGCAAAVLVRALEPLAGETLLRRRRGVREKTQLLRGPGCVAQGLGLSREHDGLALGEGALWVSDLAPEREGRRLLRGPRIGIRVGLEHAWRWWLEGHPCVSAGRTARARGRSALTPPQRSS